METINQNREQDCLSNKSIETTKSERRAKDLDNLSRNLMKKIYQDLYIRNTDLYIEKNLTFENFLFHFYNDYISLIDFNKPDYKLLLERMDLIVKSKFDRENRLKSGKNKLEIKKELNFLSQEDEWALIDKYMKAVYDDEMKKLKEEKNKKQIKYFENLDKQIKERKNYIDPIEKKKEEVYLFREKEAKKNLNNLKIMNQEKLIQLKKDIINYNCISIEYLEKLEKDNFNIDENNKDLICFKIDYLMNINNEKSLDKENLASLTKQIINEKDLNKIKKGLGIIKYQEELLHQMDNVIKKSERPSKMSLEERKINKKLLDKAKEYFKKKYQLSN
jgi:hypothetical protein